MPTGPVLTSVAQQANNAASALEASLPELASAGRAVLQEMVAFLASGGQAIPGQAIGAVAADLAADATVDVISPSLSPLDTSLSANAAPQGTETPLSKFREEFAREARNSFSHVAEIPDERREPGRKVWGIGLEASLSDLKMPERVRKPFVAL